MNTMLAFLSNNFLITKALQGIYANLHLACTAAYFGDLGTYTVRYLNVSESCHIS